MRVESFKISNYRSIESAEVPIAQLTCLVGANNEGKSNILRAVVAAMSQLLSSRDSGPVGERRRRETFAFVPDRDTPINKPGSKPKVQIRLQLDDGECAAFEQEIGHKINGELRFEVDLSLGGQSGVKVVKQKSGPALTKKSPEIAEFVADRLRFEYIPAVRTADHSNEVVRRLTVDQLRRNVNYTDLLDQIQKIERPVIEEIQSDLLATLKTFLPDVQNVIIDAGARIESRRFAMEIDDGVATDLSLKGDGVQSLAAIALARRAAQSTAEDDVHLVLAVEEPETHLHPAAIRRLRSVLREIAEQQQVILTTHSPLLIDTEIPATNVVVADNVAKPAASVKEIRDTLGVEIADNLTSARLVVLVEGPTDATAFAALVSARSGALLQAINRGELRFDPIGGASNLSARASAMRAAACSVFVIVDGDNAGDEAIKKAFAAGQMSLNDYLVVPRKQQSQAELEDLFLGGASSEVVLSLLGVPVVASVFSGNGPKWSDRLRTALKGAGKSGSKPEMDAVKNGLAARAQKIGLEILNAEGKGFVDAIADELERRLGL